MAPEFSDPGETPTDFEREMFARAVDRPARDIDDLWLLLARRIGLEAVCVVLDELGGDEVRVPTRSTFMQRLWKPHRNARIEQLLSEGHRQCEVAKTLNTSRHVVNRVRARRPRHAHAECAKKRV